MSEINDNKTKWLHLRLSEAEFQKLRSLFNNTTCRKLSEYARKKLLDKPVVITTRNKSIDDLMSELVSLRTELNNIGNNLNQAVKKLHTTYKIPEFKQWLLGFEIDKKTLSNKLEAIKSLIKKLVEQWLQ